MSQATDSRRVRLHIEGMHCGGCVAGVERALRSVPGVLDASVNLTHETAAVQVVSDSDPTSALVNAVRAAGYDAEPFRAPSTSAGPDVEQRDRLRLRRQRQALVQAVGLALPVMALEYLAPTLASSHTGGHVWWRVLQALLCTMLLVSPAGAPILVGGFRSLLHRTPNMDLLISLGVVAGYASSMVGLIGFASVHFHFDMVVMILGFINVGRYLEARSRREATGALSALARRMPKSAERMRAGQFETIPVEAIRLGDHLRILEDAIIPVDGRVLSGAAAVDESPITGEFVPIVKSMGDPLLGGTVVREGSVTMEATRLGIDSAMGRILQVVQDAQSGRTVWQRFADRVSGVFVPIVIGLAVLTFVGWQIAVGQGWATVPEAYGHGSLNSPVEWGLMCAIGVLVVACPCALGLATPTVVLVATATAAARGVLVRDAVSLEAAGQIDMVLFDKTGTLTLGQPKVDRVVLNSKATTAVDERYLLTWAASTEQVSRHPLARAIVERARVLELSLREADETTTFPGKGIEAKFGSHHLIVGSAAFLLDRGVDVEGVLRTAKEVSDSEHSVVGVALDGAVIGFILLSDSVRPGAADSIADLRKMGIETAMITGDRGPSANSLASRLGIGGVHAEMSPEDKLVQVRHVQTRGSSVAFVGDGINDAPALTAADVGIAFAAGTESALEAADITLVGDDLRTIPWAIRHARRSVKIIKQNLFWAFFYNLAVIPLAAIGQIAPRFGAAVMMVSSITVVLNSLRLRERSKPSVGRTNPI